MASTVEISVVSVLTFRKTEQDVVNPTFQSSFDRRVDAVVVVAVAGRRQNDAAAAATAAVVGNSSADHPDQVVVDDRDY